MLRPYFVLKAQSCSLASQYLIDAFSETGYTFIVVLFSQ
jgi:hypothetical protein